MFSSFWRGEFFSFAVKHLASLRQSQSPMFGVFIFYGRPEGESSCNKACSFCRSVTTLVNLRENEQSSNRKLRPLHLFSLLNVYFFTLSACHACILSWPYIMTMKCLRDYNLRFSFFYAKYCCLFYIYFISFSDMWGCLQSHREPETQHYHNNQC